MFLEETKLRWDKLSILEAQDEYQHQGCWPYYWEVEIGYMIVDPSKVIDADKKNVHLDAQVQYLLYDYIIEEQFGQISALNNAKEI